MKKTLLARTSIVGGLLALILVAGLVTGASAKSLYVIAKTNVATAPINTYEIQPAPSYLAFQNQVNITQHAKGPFDVCMDSVSRTLFVTYAGSNVIEIVDAETMAPVGGTTALGASSLAGIEFDQDKSRVYTVNRFTGHLYVFKWDSVAKTLTLESDLFLAGVGAAHGIALDGQNDLLYVADSSSKTVRYFRTSDWTEAGSFMISQNPMSIAVDVAGNLVYTGNGNQGYGSLQRISKYDRTAAAESTVFLPGLTGNFSDHVMGLAVDQNTGLVYATTGNEIAGGSDKVVVLDSGLALLASTGDIGDPAGLCLPDENIVYSPLSLTMQDGLSGQCVSAGADVDYTICCDNTANNYAVHGVVLVDTLPANAQFVSATGGGVYDSAARTVTWNLGELAASAAQVCVHVAVTVDPGAAADSSVVNRCVITGTETGETSRECIAKVCASQPPDPDGYTTFDMGKLKPLVNGVPQVFCIDVALKGLADADGKAIMDPATGCQKMEYDWTNSSFVWRKIDAYFVQGVSLEKTHVMRKAACNLLWTNDYILQQGKERDTSQINLCWPLLYETEGTQWVLTIVYQTNPAVPNPEGRSVRVHKERYVWTVDWKAADFSEFRARLNYFASTPAGACELFAVTPLELRKILWLLDGFGCREIYTWDPGITVLLQMGGADNLQVAADKAVVLEQVLDDDSCTDPCNQSCATWPINSSTGILNTCLVPAGSVLLTDFYYAASQAGLLRD